MKLFICKIFVFLILLLIIDRTLGYTFEYMTQNTKGGYIGHHNYIKNETHEDILIFGSSRAIHHYNPQILSDSLGLSCYNCGQDGNGIVLFYGWWQLIKEHYQPKFIIYDISPSFDLLVGEDNHKYLGWLKESYDNASIQDIFNDVDNYEKYKMFSLLYRYNSKFHQIIADYVHPIYKIKANGFRPLYGEIDTMRIKRKKENYPDNSLQFDTLKISYLKRLINDSNGTKLIFVSSPIWYGVSPKQLTLFKNICQSNGVIYIDFSNDPKYVHNNEYYKDGTHLNAHGADSFTVDLVKKIKSIIHSHK